MNNPEGLEFIRKYFDELFVKRNINALDLFLDEDYQDDDIPDPQIDHIKNSKEFLLNLFRAEPTIGVNVKDALTMDGVIAAFLEWYIMEASIKRIIRKGVAIFVLREGRILKRHNYFYYEE